MSAVLTPVAAPTISFAWLEKKLVDAVLRPRMHLVMTAPALVLFSDHDAITQLHLVAQCLQA